ncbi:cupin domain-containing protein [Owenweeksia hongkongensis]|uniref:cupin domain-containing protein n=1 Tax=Owenweeksia hongkongensis TaxID=253245 RepID=UPI003A955A78
MHLEVEKLIRHLSLEPHPEGGFYKETYRSKEVITQNSLAANFEGERNCCTGIYFLLTSETFSAFHRIKQDEMWHFYQGSPLLLHTLSPTGDYRCTEIGADVMNGQQPQFVVEAGAWFGATVKNPNDYSLVGCTVSPGFDFHDFELAKRKSLTDLFPNHSKVIASLTRE